MGAISLSSKAGAGAPPLSMPTLQPQPASQPQLTVQQLGAQQLRRAKRRSSRQGRQRGLQAGAQHESSQHAAFSQQPTGASQPQLLFAQQRFRLKPLSSPPQRRGLQHGTASQQL